MEKPDPPPDHVLAKRESRRRLLRARLPAALLVVLALAHLYWVVLPDLSAFAASKKAATHPTARPPFATNTITGTIPFRHTGTGTSLSNPPFGRFPRPGDPFSFIPCTSASLPPALEDRDPAQTWAKRYDPNPEHWSWGNRPQTQARDRDPFAGRPIYMCGYVDVPLDYTNKSDPRIARLAVTKLQAAGLKRHQNPVTSGKSKRTIVVEPGGPGGSGTEYVWRMGQSITDRLSGGQFDVLGWDPRGVNTSLPAFDCFPSDADLDRWSLLTGRYYEELEDTKAQLHRMDAFQNAVLRSCWERLGDLGRFMDTAFVARDMEEIRKTLGEDELTAYLVSYGTGIGQTYANMFPNSVGRVILDGTEYVRDHRLVGGFGWTALDNITDAWHDGFLGECVDAGPEYCALAKSPSGHPVTLSGLEDRMAKTIKSLTEWPLPAYTEKNGPSLVTYSALIDTIYSALYTPASWPALAQMLYELEQGNTTLAAEFLDKNWAYDPTRPSPKTQKTPSNMVGLGLAVICADAYDAPAPPGGLAWWEELWVNMTAQSWIGGNGRFFDVFGCRHFTEYWPQPAEVYRGSLDHTLKHPVLLLAETYDPATPLRNGRRLLGEMGANARLVVHHGYGHSSNRDRSACTDAIARAFIADGKLPADPETDCYADEKPYRYGVNKAHSGSGGRKPADAGWDAVAEWRRHLRETEMFR